MFLRSTWTKIFASLILTLMAASVATAYTWEGDTLVGSDYPMSNGNNWTGGTIITTGTVPDELVFPAIDATTLTTNPTVDAAFSFPKISVTGGAYTFNAASGGSLTLNAATTTGTAPGLGLIHESASPLIMNADFATGNGTGGYVHIRNSSVTFNGQVIPGNLGAANANTWLQFDNANADGTSGTTGDIFFTGPFISSASANDSNGAATANAGGTVNRVYFGGSSLFFHGTAHLGNIGAAYTGVISLSAGSNGTLSVEHSNGLGAGGATTPGAGRTYILSTGSGKVTLSNNITLGEGFVIAGRTGLNINNPQIENTSGTNTLKFISIIGSSPSNAAYTYTLKSSGGSLILEDCAIGTNASSSNGTYNFGIDTDANTDIAITVNLGGNIGFRQNGAKTVSLTKDGAGTFTNNGVANNYLGTTTVNAGLYVFNGVHTATPGAYTVNATGTLQVNTGKIIPVALTVNTDGKLTGNGTVSGAVTIQTGGHIAPGTSAGKLTLGNNLSTDSGIYNWQLATLTDQSTGTAGTDFDQIVVTSDLALSGTPSVALDFSLLALGNQPAGGGAFWNSSHTWKIIDTATLTGDPNTVSLTGTAGPGTWSLAVGAGADLNDIFLNYTASVVLLTGDVNGDNIVNQLDLNVVFGNWLATGATLAQGDANNDGVINQLDINTITGNWLATGPAGGVLGSAVPEPATLSLLTVAMLGVCALRRQRMTH